MGKERDDYGETLQEKRATDRHREDSSGQFPGHKKVHKGFWVVNTRYMWVESKQAAVRMVNGMLGTKHPKCYGPEIYEGLDAEMTYEDAKRLMGALKWEQGEMKRPYLK